MTPLPTDPDRPTTGELLRRSHPTVDSPTYRALSGHPDAYAQGGELYSEPRTEPERDRAPMVILYALAAIGIVGLVVWWVAGR